MAIIPAEPYDFSFDPASVALVIIDMQRDFVYPGGFGEALGNNTSLLLKAVPPTEKVLKAARKAGRCGRDGDCSPPPAQIPACGFSAPGSCRRSNVISVQGLACPIVPIRRRATPVTCFVRHRVRSMRCRPPSLRPGSFPPRSPPPLIAGLFERFAGVGSEEAPLGG